MQMQKTHAARILIPATTTARSHEDHAEDWWYGYNDGWYEEPAYEDFYGGKSFGKGKRKGK